MKKFIYVSGLITCVLLLNLNEIKAQIYFGTNTLSATGSALGTSNTSNASYTFASGIGNSVTGNYSMSTGYYSQAGGHYSVSMGVQAYANGYVSFAIGNRSRATGYEAYSFGSYARAEGTHSYSIGRQSIVTGGNAYAFGYYSGGSGDYAFSIGSYSTANANNSYSIGDYVSTSSTNSMTIGRGINTSNKLNNNQSNTLMVGFNSDTATFFVGPSTGLGTFGKVGIATSSPIRTFDVNGMSHFSDTMSIGTSKTNGSMLAVAGKISAEEVEISLTTTWPDFVFSSSYELSTLAQVEEYINQYSHLPNVPSADEVAEKGINIAEMDAILLQKIEELTLYAIAQQKQIDEQKKLIEEQSKLVEALIKEKK
ncbi:MAG: hypothetical protein OQJ96_01310 [Flavobacteriales bacterium]|nr:hypothetical protein [Flavobacteriales bacterium]MCW8911931.1 hypothetical protein [Flavobacteriales bacterium]MCW8937585.1 hypothetical protein [Flavobacteriales bacterium]MCW8968597.1 hypothetical protein [Flavobacteriales bacterium]MCW8990073.1 hypothetical protein [Flavobacteriales bacterium]